MDAIGAPSIHQALPLGFNLLGETLRQAVTSEVPFLRQASEELIAAGGKRLRPKLVFVSFLASGGEPFPKDVIDAAAGIELLHTASLVHDDILDDADLRRGRPTVQRQLGPNRALLVGDFVFGRATEVINHLPQDVRDAITGAGVDLAEGEALELELTRKGASTLEQYFQVIAKKTASLLETACYAGARLADAPVAIAHAMADFGFYAGIAFQLVDDLLDVEGITELTGKPVGLDLQHGVPNAALLVALEAQLRRGKKLVPIANAARTPADVTRTFVRESRAPQRVLELAQMYAKRAEEALKAMPDNAATRELRVILKESVDRSR
jgi:geranylgeranyl pyrophosphate synthase